MTQIHRSAAEEPQRHRDTEMHHREKTQRRRDAERPRKLEPPVRTRPATAVESRWPEPLFRTPAFGTAVRTQRPALSESAGLVFHVDQNFAFEQARLRRDRRTGGASAGGKSTDTSAGVRVDARPAVPGPSRRPVTSPRYQTPIWVIWVPLCDSFGVGGSGFAVEQLRRESAATCKFLVSSCLRIYDGGNRG